jgi:hypothetical protein
MLLPMFLIGYWLTCTFLQSTYITVPVQLLNAVMLWQFFLALVLGRQASLDFESRLPDERLVQRDLSHFGGRLVTISLRNTRNAKQFLLDTVFA